MTLRDQLIRDEGLKLTPYRDSVGKLTIGVGRNLEDTGISREEAGQMLDNDIQRAKDTLLQALPWAAGLDDARQGVLLAMTFNMGVGGLLGFKRTLQLVQAGQYAEASQEMLRSRWAQQVGVRAQRLAIQMESGHWQ